LRRFEVGAVAVRPHQTVFGQHRVETQGRVSLTQELQALGDAR
jgi:hypothetical protein